MDIQISGKQIDVGTSLRSHVKHKVTELISKYSNTATDIVTTFSKDRYEFLCDISIHISTGMTAQSKGRANDIYDSFENSLEKIDKQFRRYKRRLKNHHIDRKKPIQFINASSYIISTSEEDPDSSEKESLKPLIIAEMQTKIPTLSVGEAVMQMELMGSNLLIFNNSFHKKINVVHMRDDGNVGWVDPEHSK
jgi:ribosomal subunit interface protein